MVRKGALPVREGEKFRVDLAIGDFDSVASDALARVEAEGAVVERHPAAKDATDLELAMLDGPAIRLPQAYAELMETVRVCSLGQITDAFFEVGGQVFYDVEKEVDTEAHVGGKEDRDART